VEEVFEGERTWVFWVGLFLFAQSCIAAFSASWWLAVTEPDKREFFVRFLPPCIFSAVVFIIIGLYMMATGVKKQNKT